MKARIGLGVAACAVHCLGHPLGPSNISGEDVIMRDVAIIGGGSSGTHAAIRLKDHNQTVVVIERDGELGGHVRTYTANSGIRVNYGVSNFQNYSVVREFFSRFDIPLVQYVQPGDADVYVDFSTGQPVPNGTLPVPDFTAYLAEVAKYPYLGQSWELPDPVPEDLLLPFGDFVEKYNLQDVAFTIAQFAIGNGNVFEQTTIYVLKAVDYDYIQGIVYGQGVAPETYDTQSLFNKALVELGSDVLLSSTVYNASRSTAGIELVVKTPTGRKVVKAKKLLVTAPPLVDNLQPLGLDKKETDIFSKFQSHGFYTGLLNNTSLTPGARYYSADPNANATYDVPNLPDLQFIWATKDPDVYWAWYSSPTDVPEEKVKSDIIARFKDLAPGSNPEFIAYANDSPSTVGVSADEIRDGFYNDLLSLQGYKNTWYTGSTWVSDHSAELWNYTEYELLPRLM
ncbi:hypothetical protein F5X98DRAFT_334865 [Xylaria grammica]|nr:hypothetical protein F5X98DRAFT_334865 [Xylaria grammica]